MTLKEAACGDVVVIKDFFGDEDIMKRLSAMGLRKGAQFLIEQKCGRNLLLKNGDNRFIISKELAKRVIVELVEKGKSSCEEISCELIDKACPGEGKTMRHRCRHRKRWGFLQKICPFLKKE
ncbi:MAG: FeoA family protein [Caldimicrobium sp.]|jgi:Fe2+ transport system protein FeoA|uniref:Ferrous iron transporter FeoA-like domain-containing protein n=1 Tax=Caldimicrobium thiodismutans TaxID=1653476 RepID=A0A2N7PIV0_9BACT|nr:MAG: hypothetical protein C0197_05285 [Caldimicrobium thiodismutans]